MTSSFPGQKAQSRSRVGEDVIRISVKEESRITSQRWCTYKVSSQVTPKLFFHTMTKGMSMIYPTRNERLAWIHGEQNGNLEEISLRMSVSSRWGSWTRPLLHVITGNDLMTCRCIRRGRLRSMGFELRRQSTDWKTKTDMTQPWEVLIQRKAVIYKHARGITEVVWQLPRPQKDGCSNMSGSAQVLGQEWRLTQESEGKAKIHHPG